MKNRCSDAGEFSRRITVMRDDPSRGRNGAIISDWVEVFKLWSKEPKFNQATREQSQDRDGGVIRAQFVVSSKAAERLLIKDRILDHGSTYVVTFIARLTNTETRIDCDLKV